MELSKEIAMWLHDNNHGIFDEQGMTGNIFMNTIPDAPNQSIGVFTQGGPPGDRKNEYGKDAIQLLIRSEPGKPLEAEKKARAIINGLNGLNEVILADGGHYIIDVEAVQGAPNNIGTDVNGRYEFSQNFIIEYVK